MKPIVVDILSVKFIRNRNNPMIGIYKITSPTGKIYVGQSLNIENRFNTYKLKHCKKQNKLYSSLEKHGIVNHVFEIIHVINEYNMEILDSLEREYIIKFDSFNNGLNLTTGGFTNSIHSEESKKKRSESQKGKLVSESTREKIRQSKLGRKHTEAHKIKNREARLGEKNHFYGKTHSDEVRKANSEWHKKNQQGENHPSYGLKRSEETKQKIREKHLGKKQSPEQIKKQSERMKGENNPMFGSKRFGEQNPMFGKKQSEETKLKISAKNLGRKVSDLSKIRMGAAQKGRKHSDATKNKMSESRKLYFKNLKLKI